MCIRDSWFELEVDIGLLDTDLFKCAHDISQRVDVFSLLVDLEPDSLDLILERVEQALRLTVDIFRKDDLPAADVLVQGGLDSLSLQGEGSDLMGLLDLFDLS